MELPPDDYTTEPEPYGPERMLPLADRAIENRLNPKGIAFIYLADDLDTAVAEMRPWRGLQLTVAEFWTSRLVRLLDTRTAKPPRYGKPGNYSRKDDEQRFWYDLDGAFSTPVSRRDDIADYAPTQVIAEAIADIGLDGVVYRSALASGSNFCLFNADLVVHQNAAVLSVSNCQFACEEET